MAKCVWCGRRKRLFEKFNKYGFCPECKAQVRQDIEGKISEVKTFLNSYKNGIIHNDDERLKKSVDAYVAALDDLEEMRERVPMFKSSTDHLRAGLTDIRHSIESRDQTSNEPTAKNSTTKSDDEQLDKSVRAHAVILDDLDETHERVPMFKCSTDHLKADLVDIQHSIESRDQTSSEPTAKNSITKSDDEQLDKSVRTHAVTLDKLEVITEPKDDEPAAKIDAIPVLLEHLTDCSASKTVACIDKPKTLTVPIKIEHYELAYIYRDVFVVGIAHANLDFGVLSLCEHVDLIPDPDNEFDKKAVKVLCNNQHLGFISSKRGTLQRMVHQWTEKKLPIFSAITSLNEDDKKINIVLGFYQDEQEILDKCETINTKLAKTSKKDSFGDSRQENLGMLSVGDVLEADYDWESETYVVTGCNGFEMGELSKNVSSQLQEQDGEYYPHLVVEDIQLNEDLKYIVKIKIYLKPVVS